MKKETGITLVSLVVTIIILIILAGISINTLVGDNGIITTDKLLNFKKKIAIAISNEGVTTQETDSEEVMVNNIGKILQERTKTATATADNLSSSTTAWVRGEQIMEMEQM